MSLRSAAETVDARVPPPKCSVAKVRLDLDDLDLKFFNDLLKSGKTSVYISDVLTEAGKKVSAYSIQRHRKRTCNCAE